MDFCVGFQKGLGTQPHMLETSSIFKWKRKAKHINVGIRFFSNYLDFFLKNQKTENDPKNDTFGVQKWTWYANIKKIKTSIKNLIPTFCLVVFSLSFKKKMKSLAYAVVYLSSFEIRNPTPKIQDGRQLNMQIRQIFHIFLLFWWWVSYTPSMKSLGLLVEKKVFLVNFSP